MNTKKNRQKKSTGSYTVKVFRDNESIESIRDKWHELYNKQSNFDTNADLDHFNVVNAYRTQTKKPYVVVVLKESEIIGIVAGRIDEERMACSVGYFTVFNPKVVKLTIVYGGILFNDPTDEELCKAALSGVLNALTDHEADIVSFDMIENNSILHQNVCNAASFFTKDRFPVRQNHWVIEIKESYDKWLGQLSKSWVKKIRKKQNKLVKDFGEKPTIKEYSKLTELDKLIEDSEQIAKKTYQRGMRVGFSKDSLTYERYRLAAEKGWLKSFVLYVGDVPVAYQQGFINNNVFFARGRGYDPKYRPYSVGHHLFLSAIEAVHSEGDITRWDFGIGGAEHKDLLGSRSWDEITMKIFAPTIYGVLLNMVWSSTQVLSGILRNIIKNKFVSDTIKRVWRRSFISKKY